MKNSILVILAMLLNACGGEAFTAEFEAAGGEAGETATGGSATASAGETSAAGQHAGGSNGGAGLVVSAGAPAGGGGSPDAACEFDVAALTAALPSAITWSSFDLAKDNMCAACGYEPCGEFKVTWGNPVVAGNTVTYQASYSSNRAAATNVRLAASSSCGTAKYGMCDLALAPAPIAFTVARDGDSWRISGAKITVDFVDDACTLSFGKPGTFVEQMNIDLQAEMAPLLINLKIPCN